jgi:hypothetical protein
VFLKQGCLRAINDSAEVDWRQQQHPTPEANSQSSKNL